MNNAQLTAILTEAFIHLPNAYAYCPEITLRCNQSRKLSRFIAIVEKEGKTIELYSNGNVEETFAYSSQGWV